ncbi:hypothetical protein RHMOL_Rhmol08G0227300 [Rhododendron molle]|uniref:Uncharacterized protein n=1 Tax=Rhododendron molle TaxID=49168 RepID=A0ACC0MTE6_RHOML|nr:hypothetical protein RHMOL_Rhmol08G0227300 [Rhododendron molle]
MRAALLVLLVQDGRKLVKLLVKESFVDRNAKNSATQTALDIALLLEQSDEARSIVNTLRCAGALESSSSANNDYSLAKFLNSPARPSEVVYKLKFFMDRKVSMDRDGNRGVRGGYGDFRTRTPNHFRPDTRTGRGGTNHNQTKRGSNCKTEQDQKLRNLEIPVAVDLDSRARSERRRLKRQHQRLLHLFELMMMNHDRSAWSDDDRRRLGERGEDDRRQEARGYRFAYPSVRFELPSLSMELRNIGLVVAVLIATATFTAVLSPPGGVGGGGNDLLSNGSNVNATVSSTNNLFGANTSFINATLSIPTDNPVKRLLFKDGPGAGTYGYAFRNFYVWNTGAFVLSMAVITFVLPIWNDLFALLQSALLFMMIAYGCSFSLISPSYGYSQIFFYVRYPMGVQLWFISAILWRLQLKLSTTEVGVVSSSGQSFKGNVL